MRRTLAILFIALAGILISMPAYAQDAGTPAGFFGPIVPAECNCESEGSAPGFGCLLAVLNNLVVFAVSLGVIIIVLVIAYAGFLFMFTAANPENRSQAKKMFWNAIIGMAIVLGSWLIVNTLLGALGAGGVESTTSGLAGGSKCIAVQQTPAAPPDPSGGGGVDDPIGGTDGCPTCASLSDAGFTCKTAASCTADPALISRLADLQARFGDDWRITEAYPPTYTHRARCHTQGTCVDVGFSGIEYTEDAVVRFMSDASASGLRPVFETTSCTLRTAIRNRGYSAYCRSDGGGYERITGTHFSVYGD